jgi:hypothetical protein
MSSSWPTKGPRGPRAAGHRGCRTLSDVLAPLDAASRWMAQMSDETNERLVKALDVVEQAASKLEALHDERLSDVLDEVSELRVEIIAALAGFPPPFAHSRDRPRARRVVSTAGEPPRLKRSGSPAPSLATDAKNDYAVRAPVPKITP